MIADIIKALKHLASLPSPDPAFLSWVEDKIIDVGKSIYKNNLPNMEKMVTAGGTIAIIRGKKLESEVLPISRENLFFISLGDEDLDGDGETIFIKFITALMNIVNREKRPGKLDSNWLLAVLSSTFLLKADETCINLYNVKDMNTIARMLDFDLIEKNTTVRIINKDDGGIYRQNDTLIDPVAGALRKNTPLVFDMQVGDDAPPGLVSRLLQEVHARSQD